MISKLFVRLQAQGVTDGSHIIVIEAFYLKNKGQTSSVYLALPLEARGWFLPLLLS